MPKFGYFGSKSITFLILLAKFRMCSISNVLTSNLTLVFENFEPKSPFWSKSINCLILTKFFVCCFAGADFKSDICFQKFLAQIPKFKNFGPKSIKPFNLNDSLSVRYFEGADFKSDICFQKFPVQIHKSLILRNLACMLF